MISLPSPQTPLPTHIRGRCRRGLRPRLPRPDVGWAWPTKNLANLKILVEQAFSLFKGTGKMPVPP